jgi:hypothetical protein
MISCSMQCQERLRQSYRLGILPQINTGMAGKVAGTGQVGAGLVTPPAGIFPAALAELARRVP